MLTIPARWRPLLTLLLAAAALRLPWLLLPPLLSDDVYRYAWEGLVWRDGHNPFRSPPDAPELSHLRHLPGSPWILVNHRAVSTVYPPLAQALFALLAPGGIYAWKALAALADLATAALLYRRRPAAGWCWALLPLTALESAGSGHLEAPAVAAMILALHLHARRRLPWAAAAAWSGAMIKLLPAILLPALLPRRRWPAALLALSIATLAALLALDAGPDLTRGLTTYQRHWSYNGSVYPILSALTEPLGLPDPALRHLLQLAGALICLRALRRYPADPGRVALHACAAFALLSPTVHPWYLLWPLAAALWTGRDDRAWILLAALAPLAYLVLLTRDPATGQWQEPIWIRFALYTPFYAALLAPRLLSAALALGAFPRPPIPPTLPRLQPDPGR